MRLHQISLLTAGVLLAGASLSRAEEANVGELTRELTGEKPAAARTPQQLEAVYAKVLEALMPNMGNEDPGKRNDPQSTLERIAFQASRPGADADRAACSKAIAARLGPQTGPFGRVWLLRQLERIGRGEAVPAVAKLLADNDALVRESGRRALQKNPAAEANTALQQAIASADAAWRVALINALGERRDPANLDTLLQEAASGGDGVRTAAVVGLAKLGNPSALPAIESAMNRGTPRARQIAVGCCAQLADALAARGCNATALNIYKKLLNSPGAGKCAGIVGIGRCGSVADLPILLTALADRSVKVRRACVDALCLLQGSQVAEAIAARVKTATPEAKLALLRVLARRGEKGTVAVFLAAAKDGDEAVQVAALAGLGTVGNGSAVPVLLQAAAGSGEPQETARQSLQTLPGADVDQAILALLADKDVKIRVEVVRALAARHVVAATGSLLKAVNDVDGGVRNEALRALGNVAPGEALAALVAVVAKASDDGIRNGATDALVKTAQRVQDIEARCEPILQAIGSASGPAKYCLLVALGRLGGQKSLECLRGGVKGSDEKVRDVAIRAMTEWPDATDAADLLSIAKSAASETHRVLAVRGYIRVCCIRSDRPDELRARMLITGLQTAARPEEKRQALGGLAEVRHLLALQAVVPCMGEPALREEACYAAVRLGRDLWNDHPEAVRAALWKVLAVSMNEGLKQEAKEPLEHAEQKLKESRR
jgi:HEAT repeat protein